MRKVLCICSVLLILVLSVAPAFAASDPWHYSLAADMSIPFNYVVINDGQFGGTVVPWPNSVPRYDSSVKSFTNNAGYFNFAFRDNSVTVDALFANATNITLHSDFFIFASDLAKFEVSSSFDNVKFLSVSMTGSALKVVPSENSDRYVLEEVAFGLTKSLDSIGYFDLSSILDQAIYNSDMKNHYVAVKNLDITLDFWVDTNGGEAPIPELSFRSRTLDQSGLMRSWFGYCNIKTKVEANNDFISWILPVLDNFLDFELAPGLSFNTILYVIVVIGLALWFIKIMS